MSTNEPLAPRRASPEEVPVIDLAGLRDGSRLDEIGQGIYAACTTLGFFYIANHGLDEALIDRVFAESPSFFALPMEDKRRCYAPVAHRGYISLGNTQYPGRKADLKEGFDMGPDLGLDDSDVAAGVPLYGPNAWPDGLPAFRSAMERLYEGKLELAQALTHGFAAALGMPTSYFDAWWHRHCTTLRVMHYPEPSADTADRFGLGAHAHADYGFFTVLAQDPGGGLEIQAADGEWVSAPYIEGTLIVNTGDLMQRWSNDVFRSNLHRVVNRLGRERYSIPMFVNLNHATPVECLPTCTSPSNPPHHPPTTSGENLASKMRKNQGYRTERQAV
jgi:isopenicillin N synthase-like dioxygenase